MHGQEPGTSPQVPFNISSQDKAVKLNNQVEKLDPVTVKELQDVVRTNIFAVSKKHALTRFILDTNKEALRT